MFVVTQNRAQDRWSDEQVVEQCLRSLLERQVRKNGAIGIAAIILIAVASATKTPRIDVFSDALAEKIEARVNELVAQGANEDTARQLVRQTIDLVRGSE